QPDLFLVYMGNNEVIGPYGPGTVFQQYTPSRALIRAGLWAKSYRLGQLLQSLIKPSSQSASAEWKGMELFAANRLPPDDPRRQAVYDHFRANLSDIIPAGQDAGARVVVCTVGTNLKDCPPFASVNRSDLTDADKARWQALYEDGTALERSGHF